MLYLKIEVPLACLNFSRGAPPSRRYGTQWFQSVKIRHKIISFDVVSRVFPSKYQQIYNYFRFRGMSFILKTCRIVAGASMIRWFHEFFRFYFWRVFAIWSCCVAGALLYRILKRHPFYPYFYRWWNIPRALCWHIFTAKMIFRNLRNSQFLHIYKKICVHIKMIKYLQEISSKRNLGLYVTTFDFRPVFIATNLEDKREF